MSLVFEPLISSALWLTLAVAVGVLLCGYARRRPWAISRGRWGLIIGLMSISAALVLGILLNPTWHERIPPPAGKPRLAIVLDDSASMAATDMPDGRSRYSSAAAIAKACAENLSGRFDVAISTFSKTVLPAGSGDLAERTPSGMTTDLATAVSASIEPGRAAGQAILLLSDGNHNAGGGTPQVLAALSLARGADAPIFTKTFGTDAEIHDLSIRLHAPQQLSFIGQRVPVTALIRRRGQAPQAVTVVLSHEGHEVERQPLFLSGDTEGEVRFQVEQKERGLYRYDVQVTPFEGELTQVNNYSTFLLRVVDEPIRVLLVEGKPYWDSKFLARTLSSDPSIELVSVVRMSEGRYLERTLKRGKPTSGAAKEDQPAGDEPAGAAKDAAATASAATSAEDARSDRSKAVTSISMPVTESWRVIPDGREVLEHRSALARFQVVVLGRESESFVSEAAADNLRDWVGTESGALVCFRGQPMAQVSDRLEKMLPVNWNAVEDSRFRMALTDRGRELRWFDLQGTSRAGETLPNLPTLAASSRIGQTKPLATILATASDESGTERPVVSFHPYGGGRVVVVEGSGMWRWAFLPPAYADHDGTYGTLWQSLLRWLVSGAALLPSQEMAIRTDQVTFGSSETATASLIMRKTAAAASGTSQAPAVELFEEGRPEPKTIQPVPAGEGPGTFRVVFGELPEGRYRARIAGQPPGKSGVETAFDVRTLLEEQLDLRARPDLMARIASSTGGAELQSDSPKEIAATFTAHLDKGRPDRIRKTPAWDRWWVLVGALSIWVVTWGIRRHSGLV